MTEMHCLGQPIKRRTEWLHLWTLSWLQRGASNNTTTVTAAPATCIASPPLSPTETTSLSVTSRRCRGSARVSQGERAKEIDNRTKMSDLKRNTKNSARRDSGGWALALLPVKCRWIQEQNLIYVFVRLH